MYWLISFDLCYVREIDECIEESNPQKPCLITKSGDDDMRMARKRKEKSTIVMEKLLNSKEKGLLTKAGLTIASGFLKNIYGCSNNFMNL